MTADRPEVITALVTACAVEILTVTAMITGDHPRGGHPYPQWATDPATIRRLLAALREDEVQP